MGNGAIKKSDIEETLYISRTISQEYLDTSNERVV